MERQELTSEGRFLGLTLATLGLVVLLAGVDLADDVGEGTPLRHAILEGALMVLGLFGSVLVARRLRDELRTSHALRRERAELAARLKATEAEAARWRSEAGDLLKGLGAALDQQFERWALSPAEKEVALLLLKGLSHKEVAEVRSVTEATARQQSRAIYKKAGLTGRNELSAFFLEDLLLPGERT